MPIFLLAWFFVFGQAARAATLPIEADAVWTKAQSPIIINDYIWLKAGVNLTIEKGAVVKFGPNGLLIISGRLIAVGAKAEPIIFTSIKDDAYGGDTNGDGSASAPAQGDWSYLSVNPGGEANLDNVLVQYGGSQYYTGAILSYRGKLNIINSIITKNNAAIASDQSTTTVSHSFIYDNKIPFIGGVFIDAGISNNARADRVVNASDNWWGTADGPCPWRQLIPAGVPIWEVDIEALCGGRPLVDLGVVYEPFLTQWPEAVAAEINPVIIVPGILGVDLVKGNDKLWLDLGHNFTDIGDEFMDPLSFNTNLQPSDTAVISGDIVRKPSILFDYTDGLINEFKSAGYAEGNTTTSTLFTFPYDWRYGASGIFSDGKSNVDALREKIEAVRALTGSNKVNIIAHSTGGLLVKKYAMDYQADNHIGKAVFVGVPNLGAPKATKVLLQGDNFGIPFLADQEMKKISANSPVSYDLSPSNEYLTKNGGYMTTVTTESGGFLIKSLDFSQMGGFLTEHNLNSQAFTNATALRSSDFDNFDLRTVGIDQYSIVGCKSGTLGKITEYRNVSGDGVISTNGYTTDDITGDGTVPMASADSLPANDSNIFYAIKANHGKMLSADGIRQKIVNIIASTTLSVGNGIIAKSDLDSNPAKCRLNGRWFGIFSPVSIEIVDQNGNRAGIASDGSVQNDIPGADYQVMGEHKFIFVPTDENQTYAINLQGTGNGVFTLKDQTISDGVPVKTAIWGNVPITASSIGQLILNESGESNVATLSLDQNGSGQSQIIKPSIIVEGNLPDDFTPPTIMITSPQPKDYLRSDTIAINAASTDTGTGVFSLGLAFDSKQVKNGDIIDPFYEKLGNHSLIASSTDFIGNPATLIVQFRIIATPESAISDIERAYALGWFKNKNTKNSLINKLKIAVRIDKKIETIEEKLNGKKIVKKIEKFKERIDKVLGRLILAELKFYKNGKMLNDRAYQILSDDINWLINN
ncbi:MAG: hypothetical protein Q7K35_05705 [bacterium]|nr:hypothetical protein [bacterium]